MSLLDRMRRQRTPDDLVWHKHELRFPVRLIDGGTAQHVAWRRWTGSKWEYSNHPEEDQRWLESQW